MAQITDFKIEQSRDERLRQIEKINSLFDVEFEEVRNAADAAGMRMSLEGMTYYFFAECVSEGKELRSEVLDSEDFTGIYDKIAESADNCVPYQSYVAMYIWVDCGFEEDSSESPLAFFDNAVQFAQSVLYDYANKAIIRTLKG